MRNTLINTIHELATTNSDINIICGDLGYGVLNQFAEKFPDRFFNAGISEQNMATVAAGMALCGKIVFTYSIGNFSTLRCIEQIRNDICYHNANVKIIAVGGGFAYGQLGMSHHATEDIAMMRALPNMRVYVPADPEETILVAKHAYATQGPCYIRLGKGGEKNYYIKSSSIDITKPISVRKGQQVTIFSAGSIINEVLIAAEELAHYGIEVSIFSCPIIKPLKVEDITTCIGNSQLVLTVEEHNIIGGLGGCVSEAMAECGCTAQLIRIGLQDVFTSIVGDQDYLRHYYGMSSGAIKDKILKALI